MIRFNIVLVYIHCCGPGSVVGIATAYGLDGPGIEADQMEDVSEEKP